MTHLRRHRKFTRRRVPSVWKPICRTLRKTGWGPIIDSAIAAHNGPTNPLPATALFAAIAYLGHSKVAYTHESALDALRRMPRPWIDLLGVPVRPAEDEERADYSRDWMPAISYDQVRRKFHWCHATIPTLVRSGGMDGFVADLLWAAIPDHAKHLRHIALDGSPHPVWARQVAHKDLPDVEGADWGWTVRDYRMGKQVKKVLGYLMMAAVLYDPADQITTPYIVGLHLSAGNTGEPSAAQAVLEQTGRHIETLDLVIADGGITKSPDVYAAAQERGGDLIQSLTQDQQKDDGDLGDTGLRGWLGRPLMPSASIAALSVNADGEKVLPTSPPRSSDAADEAAWLKTLEDWFDHFDRIDAFTAQDKDRLILERKSRVVSAGKSPGRTITCCETCGAERHGLPTAPNPPKEPKRCCRQASVTYGAHQFRLHTWQPFAYGTRTWFHIYSGARDRTEGVVADIRENMHLKGGRNDVRVRGLTVYTMLAAILGMTRNLQLSHRLAPPSGRLHKRTSKRVYKLPASLWKKMLAELGRRARARGEPDDQYRNALVANSPPEAS
jgi:hypothetical protein